MLFFSRNICRSKFIVFAASQNPTTKNGKCVVTIKLHDPLIFVFLFYLTDILAKLPTYHYDPERVSKAKHYVVPFLLNLNFQILARTSLVIVDLLSFWLNFKLTMTLK